MFLKMHFIEFVLLFLQEHPDIVSLDWIMQEIIKQLDKRPKGFYLVDILPNLKVLLKLEGMMKNASEELSMLESKVKIKNYK